MIVSQLRPALILAVWTFLVWTTRIRNIWTDDGLTTGGQVWRTALALAFTSFAVATVAAWTRSRQAAPLPWSGRLVRAFAIWTIGVWAVRAVQIALADHDLAFVLVHTGLAVVSIALAVWADRRANRADRSSRSTGSPPARV